MAAKNLFRALGGHSWFPDADAIGAPAGALLRADNLVPDETGAMALRLGSSTLYSGLVDQSVHSLYTVVINDTTYRFAGAGSNLYKNGVNTATAFDGSGDLSFGDDSYQMFVARGTTKKKYDGTSVRNWGIAAPSAPPTTTVTNAVAATVGYFDTALDTPDFVVNEGTGSYVTGYDSTASGALRLAPNATTGRASASKIFSSDQDFLNIVGSVGGDTDLFDMYVWLEDPRRVDHVTVMFGLGTGTDPYRDDYYSFDFKIKDGADTPVKDAVASTAVAYGVAAVSAASALTIRDITAVRSPDDVNAVLRRLQQFTGPRAKPRFDSSEASPAWTHFSVMRGQFKRVGGTNARSWKTVRGFKVIYAAVPGTTAVAQFDSAIIQGGGARSLTGKYRVGYRFIRDTGNYSEKSPMSPLSDEVTLTQQSLRVTIPAEAINAADPQTNQVWVYLFGGFLDTFYRFAVTTSNAGSSTMALEELDPSADGTIDQADRVRLSSVELSVPGFTTDTTIVLDILKNEMDVLTENIALEPGCVTPPDDIVAIAGPWASRMFVVTGEGYVYPSAQDSPSNFSLYHVVDLRQWGSPLWAVRTTGGIMVGMTKDIIRIAGTGDESPDRSSADLYPEPLGIGNPPVDGAFYTDGNNVVYRAADGLMQLSGATAMPVPKSQVGLLWRGKDRHGVQALNQTTGRFRLAVDNHILYMIAPEGSTTDGSKSVWRSHQGVWSRTLYPKNLLSLRREPGGLLIAGTDDGSILQLEDGTQDSGAGIAVTLLTPHDDGGSPLQRKDPFDIQCVVNTGGTTGTLDVYNDAASAAAASYPFYSPTVGTYRIDASELGAFFRSQIKITGTFQFGFVFSLVNLSYRDRPQQVMAVDTGTILPAGQGEMAWIQEVEIDCISPVNLEMIPYRDDVAMDPVTITVTANKRSLYRKRLAKGLKARRPRLLFKTTNAAGVGNIGFEPYSVRVRMRGTGNDNSQHEWRGVWPVGTAE